jgi:hypothetical protein
LEAEVQGGDIGKANGSIDLSENLDTFLVQLM